jgi:hypothetical protein
MLQTAGQAIQLVSDFADGQIGFISKLLAVPGVPDHTIGAQSSRIWPELPSAITLLPRSLRDDGRSQQKSR